MEEGRRMNRKKLIRLVIMVSLGVSLLTGCVSNGIDEVAHYEITVSASDGGQVKIDPKQVTYLKGTEVTITATPEAGWSFQGWEGTLSGQKNPMKVVIDNNVDARAVFGNPNGIYTLDITKAGSGTLDIKPLKEQYQKGDTVTITATPAEGWEFQGWDGLDREENPLSLTMDRSWNFTVVFVRADYANGIHFADSDLEMVVRNAIGKLTGPVQPEDVANLTELDASVQQIDDLDGIEHLKSLQHLDLDFTDVSVIDPLAFLTELTYLDLSKGPDHTKISKITAISNLEKLVDLNLSNNAIQDISPLYWLGDLNLLTHLDLSKNRVSDLSSLELLTNLQELNLAYNQITDMTPLASMIHLTSLDLSHNEIEDTSMLTEFDMPDLDTLNLSYNLLTDLSDFPWIWDSVNLRELDLSYNDINEIDDIYGFTNLEVVTLSNNRISDLSVLWFLPDVRILYLDNNLVEDISRLGNLTNLEELYLHDNLVTNIEPLLNLPSLRKVTLMNNPNLDFTPGSEDYLIVTELKKRGVDVRYY